MKKTKPKKLLTVLLTLYLALSIVPITAFAVEIDFLPQGVTYLNDFKHTYHTQVNVTANVSVKDSNGAVVETTQVSKSSGEFNFITEGFPSAEVLQTAVGNLQTEIETPYKARGTVTSENEGAGPIIDHFESASLYTFTPTSGNPVDFSSDLEAAKQYFNEHPDATGTFTVIRDVHEYLVYQTTYDLIVQAIDGGSQDEATINNAYIRNVKFAYRSGDTPQATAEVLVNPLFEEYEIAYECWEKMENGEPVAFWYSDESKYTPSMKKITQFEEGKTYMYSIELREKNGYTFADNCSVTINGNPISATANAVKTVDGLFIMNVDMINPKPAFKEIPVVEINNATLTFKDGDKPVFTGTTPDDAPYVLVFEEWRTDGEWTRSDEWFNDADHHGNDKDITAFDKNKSYNYTFFIKTNYKAYEEGWCFGQNTKLKINGKEVSLTRDVSDNDGHFSGATDIIMTPTAEISVIEINNTTLTFKDGDKPVFTGTVPDDAPYAFRCEWWSLDENTGIVSTEPEWGGDIYKNKITAFEAGKTYHYGVYVTAYTADISPDAKLKINGREVKYTRIGDESDTQSFWVETDLTMTPTADGHTHNYGTEWKYDETNHWHECEDGEKADITAHTFKQIIDKEATATEKGSKHEECTVCGYKKAAVDIPATDFRKSSDDQPNKPINIASYENSSADQTNKPINTASPKTGNTDYMILWIVLLIAGGGAFITATAVDRKKK